MDRPLLPRGYVILVLSGVLLFLAVGGWIANGELDAGLVFVAVLLAISGITAPLGRAPRTPPGERNWYQTQILVRPFLTGIWTGIAFGLLMTTSMVLNTGGSIGLALVIGIVIGLPLCLAITYVARNDMRRAAANSPSTAVHHPSAGPQA